MKAKARAKKAAKNGSESQSASDDAPKLPPSKKPKVAHDVSKLSKKDDPQTSKKPQASRPDQPPLTKQRSSAGSSKPSPAKAIAPATKTSIVVSDNHSEEEALDELMKRVSRPKQTTSVGTKASHTKQSKPKRRPPMAGKEKGVRRKLTA